MTHLETELQQIKDAIIEMMTIVKAQLSKGKEALIGLNKELALEVMHNEKRVNGYDIMIDCNERFRFFFPTKLFLLAFSLFSLLLLCALCGKSFLAPCRGQRYSKKM